MSRKVNVALLQLSNTADVVSNVAKAESRIRQAAAEGAQVVCLQELFNTLYFCLDYDQAHFDLAEPAAGPLLQRMQALAAELGIVLIVPFFERRAAGVYHNSAAVFDADGRQVAFYRKMHIPDDPGFSEKYYFTPGDLGFQVAETRFGKIGVLICWDQWFPEAARITAMMGAEILFYPTAIGVLADETEDQKAEFREAWEIIQRSHAVANGCYVAAANRVGTEGGTTFWGDSFVVGPFGQWVARAGETEQVLHATVDLDAIEAQRRTWPFLRDRRIDGYDEIAERML